MELQKKKNELKGTQVSVCIGAKRNIFDDLGYNNLKIKLTKSQGIKKMNFEELKEKLRKDIENRGRIIDLKEKVKGNIYKNLLKLFKNKINIDIKIALNKIIKEDDDIDNKNRDEKEKREDSSLTPFSFNIFIFSFKYYISYSHSYSSQFYYFSLT